MAAVPPVVPPVAPVIFALSPGTLNADDIIDLSSKQGRDLYNKAVMPLTIHFDGDSKNVNLFLSQLARRAESSGWQTGTGDIITIPDRSANNKNMLSEYGCLNDAEIRLHVATYLGTQTRRAQNNAMMLECIQSSLTEACFHKISNEEAQFTEGGVQSAALLYKLLMAKAIIDTRATTYQFRSELSTLEAYMGTVGSNIELFNLHVRNARMGLKARGQSADDLILNLFKGYRAAADSKFVEYIETKEELYLDGGDMDEDTLMLLALNKYTMRVQNQQWGAPSVEQEQLTALTSELKTVRRQFSTSRKKQGTQRTRVDKKRGKNDPDKWEWKKVPPNEGDPNTKDFQNKKYHWCIKHQAWTIHTPDEYYLDLEANVANTDEGVQEEDEALQCILSSINSDSESE